MDVIKLYPQYNIVKDRRVQVAPISPIAYERRSGEDRRGDDRIKLDTTLTRDIFELKSKVAQFQKSEPKETKGTAFTQNAAKAAQNSIKTDQFIKTVKPGDKESPKEAAKSNSQIGTMAGLISVVLGGTLASAFFGVAGVIAALAIGGFVGGKLLRTAITNHLKNK